MAAQRLGRAKSEPVGVLDLNSEDDLDAAIDIVDRKDADLIPNDCLGGLGWI